jgi:hypothetical protein
LQIEKKSLVFFKVLGLWFVIFRKLNKNCCLHLVKLEDASEKKPPAEIRRESLKAKKI